MILSKMSCCQPRAETEFLKYMSNEHRNWHESFFGIAVNFPAQSSLKNERKKDNLIMKQKILDSIISHRITLQINFTHLSCYLILVL